MRNSEKKTIQVLLHDIVRKNIPEPMILESIRIIPSPGLGEIDRYEIKASFSGCFRDIDGDVFPAIPDNGDQG